MPTATRVFNYSAGPAVLPLPVLEEAQRDLIALPGVGMSVMEISHRSKTFEDLLERAISDIRTLAGIAENYKILFLQGGATLQFAQVPMNLLRGKGKADYVVTGEWSKKAVKEAKQYCDVAIAASSEDRNFTYAPKNFPVRKDAAYLHYCSNETIGGVEFHATPKTEVPLVADASSHFLSRPFDVGRHGLIYAGAQKNAGPAGLTFVIVREDLTGKPEKGTPTVMDYKLQADADSMLNTPASYSMYVAGLVFKWLKQAGGLAAIEKINIQKAKLLYDYLDQSEFFHNPVAKEDRSRMNVPFTLKDAKLDEAFLKGAVERGMVQLKGHRSVGGMRASIYNAMPIEGVRALVEYMREFEQKHG
jgi:phosphoserine aminotransferase